jgi:glycosyltransferase involved in cell wall biosynthesis
VPPAPPTGSDPLVTVVITLYNLRRFVGEAIESALAQALPPGAVEVIVVDDGSTDGGGDVVRRYASVRYLRQENRGLPAARNAGLRAARAPHVMFLDADDHIHPEKLPAQLAVLRERPDVDVVYTGVRYIDVDGAPLPQHGWARVEGDLLSDLVVGNLFPPHSPLAPRALFEAIGGFDESLRAAEDWDVWARIAARGVTFGCVDRALIDYRVRPDAMHQDPARMTTACLRVLEKLFVESTLPAPVAALRPVAYQRTYVTAACEYYRAGDEASGSRWFRMAVRERPTLVTEPASLMQFCRWLLPLGYQRGTIVAAEWRRLARTLRTALRAVFADPALDPAVRGLQWRSERAFWGVVLTLARERARHAVGSRSRRNRLRLDHGQLLAFERASGMPAAALP